MSNTTAARLVSVNIGRPKALPHRGKNISSGIFKTPVEGTLRIDEIEELEGDAQVDLAADRDCWRKLLAHRLRVPRSGAHPRSARRIVVECNEEVAENAEA